MRYYVLHPSIGNDLRQDVSDWCVNTLEDLGWNMTSNYDRTDRGTFDVRVTDRQAAELFLLRWGGQVVDVEDVTENGTTVNFHNLFEARL